MRSARVCIVGGGASGLVCARVLSSSDYNFEPTIFEQQSFLGGQWNYDPDGSSSRTSSIYRDLRTNLPCSVMQFSDFPFPNNEPESYVSCKEMNEYLIAYADEHHLHKFIHFNTKVLSIDQSFTVIYSTLLDQEQTSHRTLLKKKGSYTYYSERFDAICIANGHFSDGFIPDDIPGLHNSHRTFPIFHSQSYRCPEDFRDQCVIVVGGSHSGIDITGELAAVVKQVILSKKENDIEFFDHVLNGLRRSGKQLCTDYLSTTCSFAPTIERIDGDTVYFKDQTSIKPDCIIFATGYRYTVPFLQGPLRVDHQGLYLHPLFKQLFHVDYPMGTLAFLAIPYRIVPFPFAELQAHFIARVLRGEIRLPSKDEMMREIDSPLLPHDRRYHRLNMIDYIRDLLNLMKSSDSNYNYVFTIDNERRIRKMSRVE